MAANLDLTIEQGKTFERLVRWETLPFIYKTITNITQGAPCRITATAHGVPSGWRVGVAGAKGMTDINASVPPLDSELHVATVIDANTLELNELSTADFAPYTSGGSLFYYYPANLTGYIARMQIKDKVGGTELMLLNTSNTRLVIDDVNSTISIEIAAVDTAAITWKRGVYDLEVESPVGVVTMLLTGKIRVVDEVTDSEV